MRNPARTSEEPGKAAKVLQTLRGSRTSLARFRTNLSTDPFGSGTKRRGARHGEEKSKGRMNRRGARSGHLRLVLVAAIAVPVVIASGASPTGAALDGLTKFEIDGNTVVDGPTMSDWVSESENQHIALSNDRNFTGDPVVQEDVGSSSDDPSWLDNCVHSQTDTVFATGTQIDDPDWSDNHATHSVAQKDDVCQSYFDYNVVQTGPLAGHVISDVAFTRRVSKADGSYYFVLSKGENPDIRVAGDVVVHVGYDNKGDADSIATARWEGPGPTLSDFTDVGVDNPNVDMTAAGYFAEVAIDLTALGLVPNVFDLATPDELHRVRVRTGDLAARRQLATSTTTASRSDTASTSAARSSSRRRSPRTFLATRSSR